MARCPALLVLLALVGCQSSERASLRPLPEANSYIYPELVSRARAQATAATEAFFVDAWLELEDLARGLEQTARFLPLAAEIPPALKDKIAPETATLRQDAQKLAAAAHVQNVAACNEALQRINLRIRLLRPTDPVAPAPLPPRPEKDCAE